MKEFYELANDLIFEKSEKKVHQEWNNNGFKIINFAMVKKEYFNIIKNKTIADKFHLYNDICDNDPEMKAIYNKFDKIVFKETRGNSVSRAIGWENINSYLRYHSGIQYRWFKSINN